MKANAEYIRTIMQENFRNSGNEMNIIEYVSTEIDNMPESFDCFFETSWDEISQDEQDERIKYIKNLFND